MLRYFQRIIYSLLCPRRRYVCFGNGGQMIAFANHGKWQEGGRYFMVMVVTLETSSTFVGKWIQILRGDILIASRMVCVTVQIVLECQ